MRTVNTIPTPRRAARLRPLAAGAVVAALGMTALAGCGSDGSAGASADGSPAATATASVPASASPASGPVAVKDTWVKAAKSGNSAVFGTLVNTTDTEITVVSAASTLSPMVQLHEVTDVNGKMVMRQKKGGFVIPAKGTHTLKPGGDHIMLMGITAPVKPGDEVAFTLTFKDGRTLKFTAVGKDFAGGNESYKPGMSGMKG